MTGQEFCLEKRYCVFVELVGIVQYGYTGSYSFYEAYLF